MPVPRLKEWLIHFEKFPLKHIELVAQNIDPSSFGKNLPEANISISLKLRQTEAQLAGLDTLIAIRDSAAHSVGGD